MPQALILKPQNLKAKILDLRELYGEMIIRKSHNLYMYSFTDYHSDIIYKSKSSKKKILFPFLKDGVREMPMVYIFLLKELVIKEYKKKHKLDLDKQQIDYWEDIIFIIYLTYYTDLDFSHDLKELNYSYLEWCVNNYQNITTNTPTARNRFRNAFSKVARFNFNQNIRGEYSRKFKSDIKAKLISFNNKFKNRELVDLFQYFSMITATKGI
jgi:hypothetical protein